MNGMMKIRTIQPALARPVRSLRRKMSAKTAMKIQIAMNQKKSTTSDAKMSLKVIGRALPRLSLIGPVQRGDGAA
jgi:hypothetical protein